MAGCAAGPREASLPIVSQRPALPVDFFPWQKQQPVEIPVIAGAQLAPSKPLRGLLSKPDGEGPFPAVILLHGCSGLELDTPDRSTYKLFRDYAHRYNDRGYVALVLDSYQARGLANVCHDAGGKLDLEGRTWDTYSAARYLKSLGYVDPNRIVVHGIANGGNTLGAALSTYAGGAGTDILRVDGTSQTIDLHALVTNNHISGIEVFDLTGAAATATANGPTGSNTLPLTAADVLESGSNTITILGDSNDTVNLTSGFTGATPTPLAADPTHFSVYQSTSGPAVTVIVANTLNDAPVVHIT